MAEEVRPGSAAPSGPDDDEPRSSSAMERATRLFAAHLAAHDGEVVDPAFSDLLEAHPDLRAELLDLRDGLTLFRSQQPALREHAHLAAAQRRHRLRRAAGVGVGLGLAAAAVVIVLVWLVPGQGAAATSELGADVAKLGTELLLEVTAKEDNGFDRIAKEATDEEMQRIVVKGGAGFFKAMREVVEAQPEPLRTTLRGDLETVRENLAASSESWQLAMLATIDAGPREQAPSPTLLAALRGDPALRTRLEKLEIDHATEDVVARFLLLLQQKQLLSLRVIDPDPEWRLVDGARVFAQTVDPFTQEIGTPVELGRTPLPPNALGPGDWRITVVDESGTRPRFSELRLLVQPGLELGPQVAFLRDTQKVLRGMARLDACTFLYGVPPGMATRGDSVESECSLGEYSIDPYETTCEEYSRFYRDLLAHASWFGSQLPVARPSVLETDGRCPAGLLRHPIVDVKWFEAMLYANWAGKRLPTEREWERAARGTKSEDREFPWGDEFGTSCINEANSYMSRFIAARSQGLGLSDVPPPFESLRGMSVDDAAYSAGATPAVGGIRLWRMADNVTEFTEDLYCDAPKGGPRKLLDSGGLFRAAKGESWMFAAKDMSWCWKRSAMTPQLGTTFTGLRCVKTPTPGL